MYHIPSEELSFINEFNAICMMYRLNAIMQTKMMASCTVHSNMVILKSSRINALQLSKRKVFH